MCKQGQFKAGTFCIQGIMRVCEKREHEREQAHARKSRIIGGKERLYCNEKPAPLPLISLRSKVSKCVLVICTVLEML